MTEAKLVQLQKEVVGMKHEIKKINKRLARPILEPVIIEAISQSELTGAQRKREKQALADFRAGRTGKFVTVDQVKKILHITGK